MKVNSYLRIILVIMESLTITTSEGKIQGTTLKNVFGKSYLAFRGIPYAQPPLGNLRFCKPQPPSKWSEIRDATKFSCIPKQIEIELLTLPPYPIVGSEDCLYLNVYTNRIGRKRPVMFYIFGGRFSFGNGNEKLQGVDFFMNNDVVMVIANYRLGPFGFLNLGHEIASGNQGIRDLIMALQWVQRNIEAFGGDPNNVTIFGNSAGGVISHLFTLIPETKSLFHKAILQSGTCYLPASLRLGENYKNGFKIASLLGFDSDDPEKVFQFLQTVPAEDFLNLEEQLLDTWDSKVLGYTEYGPIVDASYTKNPVIPMSINALMNKNDFDIPLIIGNVSDESILSFREHHDNEDKYQFYNKNMEEFIKNRLNFKDPTKSSEVIKSVQEFYLDNELIGKDSMWNFCQMVTDLTFIHVNRKIIEQRNEHAKASTYFYNFSHIGKEMTVFKMKKSRLQGVAHADELSYMFYFDFMQDKTVKEKVFDPKDKLVADRITTMWCNFAATGNPTPKTDEHVITTIWKPTSKDNVYYLDIGEELVLKNDKDSQNRMIYEKIKDGFLGI